MDTKTYYYTGPESRNNNLFVEEYYSSPDIHIYMNNTEQTEISYISYVVQEQLKPLYGYASRTFDEMAVGSRLVTGILKVPIRNKERLINVSEITKNEKTTYISTLEKIEEFNKIEDLTKEEKEWIKNQTYDTSDLDEGVAIDLINIRYYQNLLLQEGYDLSVTGIYDTRTISALKQYQKKNKIYQSGLFDADTRSLLNAINSIGHYATVIKGAALRSIPSEENAPSAAAPMETIPEGTKVEILSDEAVNNYYYVLNMATGTKGYVHKDNLTLE